jgi:prevent-host-death family protein
MDRIVTATEANQHFSEILREVSAGDSVTVTSRGKPVARIVPADNEKKGSDLTKLMAFMKDQPVKVIGPWTRDELYDRP